MGRTFNEGNIILNEFRLVVQTRSGQLNLILGLKPPSLKINLSLETNSSLPSIFSVEYLQ